MRVFCSMHAVFHVQHTIHVRRDTVYINVPQDRGHRVQFERETQIQCNTIVRAAFPNRVIFCDSR